MPEQLVRCCKIDDRSWYSLADALLAVGRGRLLRDPELVESIPEEDRRQIRLSGRWAWMLSAPALDLIAGEDWRAAELKLVSLPQHLSRSAPCHQPKPARPRVLRPRGAMSYRQLSDLYRQRIESGELRPGVSIGGSAALGALHGVSREVAKVAMSYLVGLVQYSRTTHDWIVINKENAA